MMPGQNQRFEREDPHDLGDVETLLRRIDGRLASAAQREEQSQAPKTPAPPPVAPVPTNLFENLSVGLKTVISVIVIVGSIVFGAAQWRSGADTRLTEVKVAIKGLADRIDRQNESFYERMSFVFTDFCRRTERENPNWRCADPITMPMDPSAGKLRFRGPSGGE